MVECNNKTRCHEPKVLHDDETAMIAVCTICWKVQTFRKDAQGRMNNVKYLKFFQKDHLQPHSPLYFKYHPDKITYVA